MKFTKIFTILMSIVLTYACAAEDEYSVVGTIYGTVTDADSGQPIQSANIVLTPTNVSTITGSDGTFDFQNLSSQQYSMSVSKTGYLYNTRKVTVTAGQNTSSDIALTPESEMTGFSLSTEKLSFGSTYSELTFVITNNSNSSATTWSITDFDENWLTVSPASGTTEMGQQSVVKVTINRTYVTESITSYIIVNAAGGSKQIMITASEAVDGGGDTSDTDDDLSVSTTTLAFGENYDTLTFEIKNNGTSSFEYGIWLVNPGWLKFGWDSETVEAGKSQTVTVQVDRSLLYGEGEVTLEIRTDVGSQYITVTAYEPISYGTVSSPFTDLDINVTDAYISGEYFYLEYLGTWNSGKTCDYFWVQGYNNSLIFNDNLGNMYAPGTSDNAISIAGGSWSSQGSMYDIQPGSVFKGSIKVKNIDIDATKFTSIKLGVSTQISSSISNGNIYFYNVPIIR